MTSETIAELLQEARRLSRAKDFAGSRTLYERVITQDADCVPAHESLAMLAFVTGDYTAAEAEFLRLEQLEPKEARHLINLGAVYNRTGAHVKALATLRKAIQRAPRNADAYYNLGISHRKSNQLSLAVSAYKEAIRLNPQFAEAYQNLGNAYSEMHNYSQAILQFQKALQIRPDFEKARVGLEHAEAAQGARKSAQTPLARAAAADASSMRLPLPDQRELSDAERVIDRQTVRRLADELSALLHDCCDFLRREFDPALMDLERSVLEGKGGSLAFSRAERRFANAFEGWSQLRAQIQRCTSELRAHEELVTVPGALTEV